MADDRAAIERDVIGNIWTTDETYRNLLYLCDDLGSRFCGSPSEHQGAEFLLSKMRDYGLHNAHLEEFPVYTWERGACELTVLDPLPRAYDVISMPYCGSCDITGELIDAGEGERVDYERLGDAVRGKVVLTDAETNTGPGQRASHRAEKFRFAIEAGAIACIFTNRNPGLLPISGALYARTPGGPNDADHEAPAPGVGVSFETGQALRRILDRGATTVQLRARNQTRLSRSYNVIGDVPGSAGTANEVVLFGGHYDGHDVAQGAADDGAGTLVGLEIGRALAPYGGRLKRTLRIICFGSEETGLLGSWQHADTYYAEGVNERLRFVMNLDGAGRGMGGSESIAVTGDKTLMPYFEEFAREHHYSFEVASRVSPHSDHFPFFLKGIPSATLSSRDWTAGMIGRGWGHTAADTVDKVHLRGMQAAAALGARLALALTMDDQLPFSLRSQDEVRGLLADADRLDVFEHHWARANRADV